MSSAATHLFACSGQNSPVSLILAYHTNGDIAQFALTNRRTAQLAREYFASHIVALYRQWGDDFFSLFRPSHQRKCQRAIDNRSVPNMEEAVRKEYRIFLESMYQLYSLVGQGFRFELGWLIAKPAKLTCSQFVDCFPVSRIRDRPCFKGRGGRKEWLERALQWENPDLMQQLL